MILKGLNKVQDEKLNVYIMTIRFFSSMRVNQYFTCSPLVSRRLRLSNVNPRLLAINAKLPHAVDFGILMNDLRILLLARNKYLQNIRKFIDHEEPHRRLTHNANKSVATQHDSRRCATLSFIMWRQSIDFENDFAKNCKLIVACAKKRSTSTSNARTYDVTCTSRSLYKALTRV